MTHKRTIWLEVAILSGAAVAAVGVWLPLGEAQLANTSRRPLTWLTPDHPLAVISDLEKRPLLDVSRGQEALAVQGSRAEAPAQALGQRYVLRGLAHIDERDVAILEDKTARHLVRVQRGQAVGDWYLSGVTGSQATLKNQEGEEEHIKLEPALPRPPLAAAAPPGAGPPARSSGPMPFAPVARKS